MPNVKLVFKTINLKNFGWEKVVSCAKNGDDVGMLAAADEMLNNAIQSILDKGWGVNSFQVYEQILVVLCTRPGATRC